MNEEVGSLQSTSVHAVYDNTDMWGTPQFFQPLPFRGKRSRELCCRGPASSPDAEVHSARL